MCGNSTPIRRAPRPTAKAKWLQAMQPQGFLQQVARDLRGNTGPAQDVGNHPDAGPPARQADQEAVAEDAQVAEAPQGQPPAQRPELAAEEAAQGEIRMVEGDRAVQTAVRNPALFGDQSLHGVAFGESLPPGL